MKFPSTIDDSNVLGVKATASTDLKQKWRPQKRRPQIWLSSGEHRLSRWRPCSEVCRVVGCRNVGEHRLSRLSVHSPCAVHQRMAVLCCTVSIPAGHDSLLTQFHWCFSWRNCNGGKENPSRQSYGSSSSAFRQIPTECCYSFAPAL